MTTALYIIAVSFVFSYLGSIPPGVINISVVQLTLGNRKGAAVRFALAAAMVEFPYAFIALQFEHFLTQTPWIENNFALLAGSVMIVLGLIILLPLSSGKRIRAFSISGFRRGIILSLLNPLAIPFWVGVVAWLKSENIIDLISVNDMLLFATGVSLGTFFLLSTLIYFAGKIGYNLETGIWLKKVPGIIFLLLGLYTLSNLMQ